MQHEKETKSWHFGSAGGISHESIKMDIGDMDMAIDCQNCLSAHTR